MSDPLILKRGTMGGVLIILLANISSGEVFKTIVLAAIGAVVSFVVSLLLKWLSKKRKAPGSIKMGK
jgi:hypothetical protein